MKHEQHTTNVETNKDTGRDTVPIDRLLRGDDQYIVPPVHRHRMGCPTAQAVNKDRLLELLLEKGRHIVSTVVPPGYSVIDDGRDPDITQVVERTKWDSQMSL
jgi:hypothetical protein